ncbi:MAG TPA: hypothetical protein VFR35_05480, partial [Actinoplanes sp.]|nr:hypothetical protein [Actinoplanes sp.]
MRVLRTIFGMLLLTIGLPALLVGAAFWVAMQHRDAGGAFGGPLQSMSTTGYALVIDDVDALLRSDAPFARVGNTRVRLTALSTRGPAFVGIAPSSAIAGYIDDVPHSTVRSVDIGTGALPVATQRISGTRAPSAVPGNESFWLRTGDGQLDWTPSRLRDRPYSLIVMNAGAEPGLQLQSTAEVRPGWLNSATWALLFLGTLTVMAGMIILAWPGRRREVVYVVEPSQVPDLMRAIGAPIPLSRIGGGRHAGTHRPRTLADSAASRPPALPQFSWPPAGRASSAAPSATSAAGLAAAPSATALAAASSPAGPSLASASLASASLAGASIAGASVASSAGAPADAPAGPPSPEAYAAATAIPTGKPGVGASGVPHRSPAPGEPLGLIGGGAAPSRSSGLPPFAGLVGVAGLAAGSGSSAVSGLAVGSGSSAVPGLAAGSGSSSGAGALAGPGARSLLATQGERATATDPLFGKPGERSRRSSTTAPSDTPVFEAAAVGAWVAETAAARARETEARAAAALARTRTNEPEVAPAKMPETTVPAAAPAPVAPQPATGDPARSGHRTTASAAGWIPTGLTRADSPRVGQPRPDSQQEPRPDSQ